jgi:hypothetical protein
MPSPGTKSPSSALSSTLWFLERPNFIEGIAAFPPMEKAEVRECWRTKGDSNWRYSSENISLRCRPNFRSCAAKWPVEKNPQKGARIWFAPQSHRSSSWAAKWRDHPIPCFRPFRMHPAAVRYGTASRAFAELQERGFIECATQGAFSRKAPHASEWRLTFNTCDVTGQLASKAFMSWDREKQNAASKYPATGPIQSHPPP